MPDPESADRYENVPTASVYDTFAETATQLTGLYTRLSDTAATPVERERWWQKVLELRDTKWSVSAHDRAQLIAHIQQWEDLLTRHRAAGG
ncbi:hypothetical protein [Streptomyces lavendulocolor]|uniref:hypothetical protein n=1 Tax=Streptomyces lavendulocolor TaxID=67316 RepID=UPI003C2D1610